MKSIVLFFKKSALIALNPVNNFSIIKREELNLKDLKYLLLALTVISIISSNKIVEICNSLVANENYYSLSEAQIAYVKELATLSVWSYAVTLITSVIFSFLFIVVVLYIVGRIFKMNNSFIETSSIVVYGWFPMLISTVVVAFLIYVLPEEKVIFNSNVIGLLISGRIKESVFFQIIEQIDVFYLWSLFIICCGLCHYLKHRVLWIVTVLLVFVIPVVLAISQVI